MRHREKSNNAVFFLFVFLFWMQNWETNIRVTDLIWFYILHQEVTNFFVSHTLPGNYE